MSERKQLATKAARMSSSTSYAPLIRLPYNDISGIIQVWSETCESMAVYEHDPDQGCKSVHVHMILLGCKYKTPEGLKRLYYKMYPDANTADGNGLWSWTNQDWPVPDINFVTYMTKGVLAPKFVKNISADKLEELRGKWSEPTPKPLVQSVIELKEPKLTKHIIMLKVIQMILAQPEHTEKTEQQRKHLLENLDDTLWFKFIRKVLVENQQMIGLYKVIDIYDSCMMYYSKEKFLSNCLHVLEKRSR